MEASSGIPSTSSDTNNNTAYHNNNNNNKSMIKDLMKLPVDKQYIFIDRHIINNYMKCNPYCNVGIGKLLNNKNNKYKNNNDNNNQK